MRYSFKMKKRKKRKKKKDKTFDTKEEMIVFWLGVVAIALYVSWHKGFFGQVPCSVFRCPWSMARGIRRYEKKKKAKKEKKANTR